MVTVRIRSRTARCLLALPCAVLAAACRDATGESTWSTRAYVYGTVARASGAPAVDYGVSALATAAPSCTEGDFEIAPAGGSVVARTDAAGHYRALVISPKAAFTGCVRVDVTAPGTADPALASARGARVAFSTQNAAGRYDSVRVDLALP